MRASASATQLPAGGSFDACPENVRIGGVIACAVSALVAASIGLATIRYSEYRYWRRWARRAFRLGLGLLAAVFAASGLLTYFLFSALGAHGVVAAVVEGSVGYALLRTQVEPISPGLDEHEKTLLRLGNSWLIGLLDSTAEASVERFVLGLTDAVLIEVTFTLFHLRFDLASAPAREIYESLVAATTDLATGTAISADARGRLRGFCVRTIEERRIVVGHGEN